MRDAAWHTVRCRTVVLTTGTFFDGSIHVGLAQLRAGRAGDPPAKPLAASLRDWLPLGRLKTGTPPRLDARTIDFACSNRSLVIARRRCSPSWASGGIRSQLPCRITYTNARTHDIIRAGLDQSPHVRRQIEGRRPALLPVDRGQGRPLRRQGAHQIFLEPEGLDTDEVYANGISTSACPWTSRTRMVRSIPAWRTPRSCARATPSSTTTSTRAAAPGHARDQGRPRPVPRRADQRHHGLRGGRGAGPHGRHQRRLRPRARAAALVCPARPGATSAC